MTYTRKTFLEDLEVGDFVTTGGTVYKVKKVLKTQLVIEPYGVILRKGDYNQERRITIKTGKLVGGYNTHFRPLRDGETADGILKAHQEHKDAKAAEKAERERKWEEKLVAVAEANADMEIEEMEMGLAKVVFENRKGLKGLLVFNRTPDKVYDYEAHEYAPAFRISSVAFASRYRDEPRSFGMPNDVTATSTREGLITLIAGTYGDKSTDAGEARASPKETDNDQQRVISNEIS